MTVADWTVVIVYIVLLGWRIGLRQKNQNDYYLGGKAGQPSISLTLNCANVPDTLAERELFGYKKGAFPDAPEEKQGLIEIANGGTACLDEVT